MAFASASANAGFPMNLGRYFSPGNFFLGRGYGNVKGKTRQGVSVALPGPSVDLSGLFGPSVDLSGLQRN